jgi:hypothetical protein
VLLHRIGWSVQVPARRAAERDEAAVAAWREETWPVIKGRSRTRAPGWSSRTSPGQGLRPPKGRTWGRRGQTPVVTVTGGSNKRVSLAALIAVKEGQRPRLVYRCPLRPPPGRRQAQGVHRADYARLLDAAHQQLGGPLVWSGTT